MKFASVLALIVVASWASADRLFFLPVGKKIPFGTARVEYMFDGGSHDTNRGWLGLGITNIFDLELTYEQFNGRNKVNSVDFSYNYLTPITDFGPGISVGVRDALNETREGRYYYIAATKYVGLEGELNQNVPLEFTIGYAGGSRNGLFAGADVPITEFFHLITEFNKSGVTNGLELRPHRGLSVRWMHRDQQVLWSLGWTKRF
ncbi:MAG: hypothetical protein KF784_03370 [Fimbriimonadaceae bacterium]|nr:hypothetical protein [Fimbriimonadaceae bacterium]